METGELARLGDSIDVAIEAGANQVNRIAFGLSDPDAARRGALRQAVLKAKAEAEAIAQALGVALGSVLSVSDHSSGPVRPFVQEAVMARAQGGPSTPIEPGLVSVRARVVLRMSIAR